MYGVGFCSVLANTLVLTTHMGFVNMAVTALASAAARRCCDDVVWYVGSDPCICFLIKL